MCNRQCGRNQQKGQGRMRQKVQVKPFSVFPFPTLCRPIARLSKGLSCVLHTICRCPVTLTSHRPDPLNIYFVICLDLPRFSSPILSVQKQKYYQPFFPFSVYSSEIKKGFLLNWISLWKCWDLWYSIFQLKFNLLHKTIRPSLGQNNYIEHIYPLPSNINSLF